MSYDFEFWDRFLSRSYNFLDIEAIYAFMGNFNMQKARNTYI